MRTYPRNSPQAAVRIAALMLLADGHLGSAELSALGRPAIAGRLGLDGPAAGDVLRDAVQDLLATGGSAWHGTAHLEVAVLDGVLREIDDPALRRDVLAACRALGGADRHWSEGEQAFLARLERHWHLQPAVSA